MHRAAVAALTALALVIAPAPAAAAPSEPVPAAGEDGPSAVDLLRQDVVFSLVDEIWASVRLGLIEPAELGELAVVADLDLFGPEAPPAEEVLDASEQFGLAQVAELDAADVDLDQQLRSALERQAGAPRSGVVFGAALRHALAGAGMGIEDLTGSFGLHDLPVASPATATAMATATETTSTPAASVESTAGTGAEAEDTPEPGAPTAAPSASTADPTPTAAGRAVVEGGASSAVEAQATGTPAPAPAAPSSFPLVGVLVALLAALLGGGGLALALRRAARREVRVPIDLSTLDLIPPPPGAAGPDARRTEPGSGPAEEQTHPAASTEPAPSPGAAAVRPGDDAHLDDLTQTWNRRRMQRDLRRVGERGRLVTLVKFDIDGLARVNDDYGDAAGDEVLRSVAEIIRTCVRGEDVVYRYGGEEFCVLLADTPTEDAVRVCERVRWDVSAAMLSHAGRHLPPITVSAGVASRDDGRMAALTSSVDDALEAAKRAGSNRVLVAG